MEHKKGNALRIVALRRLLLLNLIPCTLLVLSAAAALGDLPTVGAVDGQRPPKFGRLLLQHAGKKNTTNSTTPSSPPTPSSKPNGGLDSQRRLPVISIVVGGVAAGIALFFVILTAIGYFQNRYDVKVVDAQQRKFEGPSSAPPFMMTGAPEKFHYKELQSGTLNFTDKLGTAAATLPGGGHGRTFKGVLSNMTDVAVKVLGDYPRWEFEHQVKRVAALHHPSLVHLFGYCVEGDHRLLVYEYLPKGSLGNYLYTSSNATDLERPLRDVLSWGTRFRIVLRSARVIAFVHDHGSVHGDERMKVHGRIHSENILLTENYDPKLADFGFCRPNVAGRAQHQDHAFLSANNAHDAYLAPEWWATSPQFGSRSGSNLLTPKSDVYSFGILVLEVISGRRIGEIYSSRPSWEFPELASAFGPGREFNGGNGTAGGGSEVADLVDPELKGLVDVAQLRTALQVAYWCIQSEADARPTMAAVVGCLEDRLRLQWPPTPSSAVVFSPASRHNSHHDPSLEGFRFGRRPLHRMEI